MHDKANAGAATAEAAADTGASASAFFFSSRGFVSKEMRVRSPDASYCKVFGVMFFIVLLQTTVPYNRFLGNWPVDSDHQTLITQM